MPREVKPGPLEELENYLETIEPAKIPAALTLLGGAQIRLGARLLANTINAPREEKRDGDRLLTVKEAAAVCGVSTDWLYGHIDELPFAIRLPGAAKPKDPTKKKEPPIRFSEHGLQSWIRNRSGK